MQEKIVHLQPTDYLAQIYKFLLAGLPVVLIGSSAHFRPFRLDDHIELENAIINIFPY